MKVLTLDAKKAIGSNLKRLRSEKGFSQVVLAEKAGLKQSTLSQIENGDAWPDYNTIVSICGALKIEHTEITSHPDLLEAFRKFNQIKKEGRK